MIVVVTFKEDNTEYVSHGVDLDTLRNICLPQERLSIAIIEWKLCYYDGLGWCL